MKLYAVICTSTDIKIKLDTEKYLSVDNMVGEIIGIFDTIEQAKKVITENKPYIDNDEYFRIEEFELNIDTTAIKKVKI